MNSINRIAYSNRKIDKTMHLFWSKNMTNWAQYDNHWLSRPGWNVINVILSMVWWSNRVISLYLYIDENWIKNYHFQKNSQRIEDLASYSSFFFLISWMDLSNDSHIEIIKCLCDVVFHHNDFGAWFQSRFKI